MFRFRRLSLRQSVVAVMAFSVLVQRRTTLAAESEYRRTLGFLSILNVLNILSVLWVLGILEVRGLLRVLRTLRILRILRILAVLMLCCLRLNLLAQAAHVGSCKNAVLLLFSVLVAELIVNGDHVLQQQNRHHQQLIYQTDQNGAKDHNQDAVAAQPMAMPKEVLRCGKEHKEAQNNQVCREENVQRLQDLLYDQILEIEGIVQELSKRIELFPAAFGDNKHIGQNRGNHSQNSSDDAEYTELFEHI